MRSFSEPTCAHLLRKPLVLGVPFPGLLVLVTAVVVVQILGQGSQTANIVSVVIGCVGYVGLRLFVRFAKLGWEEALLIWFERKLKRQDQVDSKFSIIPAPFEVISPDTAESIDLLRSKSRIQECLTGLKVGEERILTVDSCPDGISTTELKHSIRFVPESAEEMERLSRGSIWKESHLYSLYRLPVTTDPLWIHAALSKMDCISIVIIRVRGLDQSEVRARVESSRRYNFNAQGLKNIDSEVTFEEASHVLQGLSRGDECVLEFSLLVCAERPVDLDPRFFVKEENHLLSGASILGFRSRFHRSHLVRAVSASDLIPNVGDPSGNGIPTLSTPRGYGLCFDPQDPRLESLHWLVVGATGSGKSFFTGAILRRLLSTGNSMSVLVLDHNRSFRRWVKADGGVYVEPSDLDMLRSKLRPCLNLLDSPQALVGMEFSDLPWDEKREAVRLVLEGIEAFLRARKSLHPIYVVLDECWKFLKDEPVLVQQFFREFRKLNGAMIAVTQSLSDFVADPSGRSIFQNAPIRILLRQGEDLTDFKRALSLNEVEFQKLSLLKQEKERYSECLIKTPYLSRIGRLYPTEEEYRLFRTDNIRAERLAEARCEA